MQTPFDERLQLLRYGKQLWKIIIITVVGAALCAALYTGIRMVQSGPDLYQAKSYYWTTYVVEFEGYDEYYVNHYTWGTILKSDLFLQHVEEWLNANASGQWNGSRQQLADMISVDVESDVHMPSSIVTSTDPAQAQLIAQAIEATLTESYAAYNDEIVKVTLMDGVKISPVDKDIRTKRAFILAAVLIFFFVSVYVFLFQIWDEGIYLPKEVEICGGPVCLGTEADAHLEEHLLYHFSGKRTAWLDLDCEEDPSTCKKNLEKLEKSGDLVKGMVVVPSPLLCAESAKALREMEAILLVVPAGKGAKLQLDRVMQYLHAEGLEATAAILRDADESLVRMYYRMQKEA